MCAKEFPKKILQKKRNKTPFQKIAISSEQEFHITIIIVVTFYGTLTLQIYK